MKSYSIIFFLLFLITAGSYSQTLNYEDLLMEINSLEKSESYLKAKQLITEKLDDNNDKWFELSKELIYCNEKLGALEENLSIFKEAHEKGYFYFIHPRMPKYKPYKDFKDFNSISQRDIELLREANKNSKTIYEVQLPNDYVKEKYYPLIFLLHGGGKNISDVKKHWQTDILNKNYIKVYIQSYRHFDFETFGWGPTDDRVIQDFKNIYDEILENYYIDTSSVLMGSISAGSNPVVELSLRSTIPIKGFILFCPNLPLFISQKQLEIIKDYNVKAFIVSGENDHFVPRQEKMLHVFDSLNIPNNYTIVKNMGHQYPENENYYIDEGINYINSDDLISPELKKYIKHRIDIGYNNGVSIGVIDSSGVRYYNYGTVYNKSIATPTKNTIYEIGSATKIFTTSLYSILLNNGKLSIDNTVGDYFKHSELKGEIRKVKLIDLATHTSGLASFPSNLDTSKPGNFSLGYAYKDFYEFLNSYKIPKEKSYHYSNTGIALLSIILERVDNKSYEELLADYLFNDLQMNNTFTEVPNEAIEQFADGSSLGVEKDHWNLSSVFVPVGGLKSTTEDMLKFLSANIQLTDYVNQNALLNAQNEIIKISETESSAIGWKISNGDYLWHNGNTGGFSAFIGINLSKNKGVVVLSNTNLNINEIGWKLLRDDYILGDIKNHVCFKLVKIINEYDLDSALSFYRKEIQNHNTEFVLGEIQLIELANSFITKDPIISKRVYEFGIELYPHSLDLYISAIRFLKNQNEKANALSLLIQIQKLYPENELIKQLEKELLKK